MRDSMIAKFLSYQDTDELATLQRFLRMVANSSESIENIDEYITEVIGELLTYTRE